MINLFQILIGLGMLVSGRRLFWVFVAGVGFVTAATWASRTYTNESDWTVLLIALVAGFIGAMVAMFMRWLGIGLAGFLGGGYLVFTLFGMFNLDFGSISWIFYVVGGIIGAILFAAFFDWALIILSSLSGAVILAQSIQLPRNLGFIVIAVLFFLGIFIQARSLSIEHSE